MKKAFFTFGLSIFFFSIISATSDIKGIVSDGESTVSFVSLTVFNNQALKDDNPIRTSSDKDGNFLVYLTYPEGNQHKNFYFVFEKAGYIRTVCKVELKEKRKVIDLGTIQIFKKENTACPKVDTIILYDKPQLFSESFKIPIDSYYVMKYSEIPSNTKRYLTEGGKLIKTKGRWIEIDYSKNFLSVETKYLYYDDYNSYRQSVLCSEPILYAINECQPLDRPKGTKKRCMISPRSGSLEFLTYNLPSIKQVDLCNLEANTLIRVKSKTCMGWIPFSDLIFNESDKLCRL